MTPQAILQTYLDTVAQSFFDNDAECYVRHVQLPFLLHTQTASILVKTTEELRDGFSKYLSFMRQTGITQMQRTVIEARTMTDVQIAGTYRTRLLKHESEVMPEFQSMMILEQGSQNWQALMVRNEFQNEHWPITSPYLFNIADWE